MTFFANVPKEEFDLSEKRDSIAKRFGMLNGDHIAMLEEVLRIVEEQDKEFIRLVKELSSIAWYEEMTIQDYIKRLDKLAGEKLVK